MGCAEIPGQGCLEIGVPLCLKSISPLQIPSSHLCHPDFCISTVDLCHFQSADKCLHCRAGGWMKLLLVWVYLTCHR